MKLSKLFLGLLLQRPYSILFPEFLRKLIRRKRNCW